MSNKKEDAMLMRKKLKNNADERKTYIKMALGALSNADKALNNKVLEKTRDIIKDTFRGEVNANLAAHHRQWTTTKSHQGIQG